MAIFSRLYLSSSTAGRVPRSASPPAHVILGAFLERNPSRPGALPRVWRLGLHTVASLGAPIRSSASSLPPCRAAPSGPREMRPSKRGEEKHKSNAAVVSVVHCRGHEPGSSGKGKTRSPDLRRCDRRLEHQIVPIRQGWLSLNSQGLGISRLVSTLPLPIWPRERNMSEGVEGERAGLNPVFQWSLAAWMHAE